MNPIKRGERWRQTANARSSWYQNFNPRALVKGKRGNQNRLKVDSDSGPVKTNEKTGQITKERPEPRRVKMRNGPTDDHQPKK